MTGHPVPCVALPVRDRPWKPRIRYADQLPAAVGYSAKLSLNVENPRINRGFREVPHTGFEPVLPP
jgi:hypothetical protein